ncbi:hypothetical protein CYMTET_33523, partial [Cymbomonas tetramitiformis]
EQLSSSPSLFAVSSEIVKVLERERAQSMKRFIHEWDTVLDRLYCNDSERCRDTTHTEVLSAVGSKWRRRRMQEQVEQLKDQWNKYLTLLHRLTGVYTTKAEDACRCWREREVMIFKPSQSKTSVALTAVATNLQRHVVQVSRQVPYGTKPQGAELYLETVTVGAPVAHSLGCKKGRGIVHLKRELAQLQRQYAAEHWPDKEQSAEGRELGGRGEDKQEGHKHGKRALLAQLHLDSVRLELTRRTDMALSQAVAAVVEALESAVIACAERGHDLQLQLMAEVGVLVHWVSLLSTSGKETVMIADFAGALEELKHVQVVFRGAEQPGEAMRPRSSGSKEQGPETPTTSSSARPTGLRIIPRRAPRAPAAEDRQWESGGGREAGAGRAGHAEEDACTTLNLTVEIVWPAVVFDRLPAALKAGEAIKLHPVLFSQGVDQNQSLANQSDALSSNCDVELQEQINLQSFRALREYYLRFIAFTEGQTGPPSAGAGAGEEGGGGEMCDEGILIRKGEQSEESSEMSEGTRLQRARSSSAPHSSMGSSEHAALLSARAEAAEDSRHREADAAAWPLISRLSPGSLLASMSDAGRTSPPPAHGSPMEALPVTPLLHSLREGSGRIPALHILQISFSKVEAAIRECVGEGRNTKHVALLTSSAHCARLMGGLRMTSCKSAKDRTSMFQTLEMAHLMKHHFAHLKEWASISRGHADLMLGLAGAMRSHQGVRLANCKLNTGRPYYAFSSVQVPMLPPELRPPPGTYKGGAT